LRYHRTTGLNLTQMQELVCRVHAALEKPWANRVGKPKSLGLYRAAEIACIYLRQNATQEFIADMHDVSQPTISRYVQMLVPVIEAVLAEFVPSAADAIEMTQGRVCLVDGTITPSWSYREHEELWSRKHGTTGFNVQVIGLLSGDVIFISDPLPGSVNDVTAYGMTPVAEIVASSSGGFADKGYQGTGMVTPRKKSKLKGLSKGDKENNAVISGLRAPIERAIAHFKAWRTLHTDYRRPYHTYSSTYNAVRALFFFSITWDSE